MVEIKEVTTKKDRKAFVEFPIRLYKGNPYFVPFLSVDEYNKFDPKKNESYDDCKIKCFLAYRNNVVIGRICGIIQKLYNEKTGEKRVRFSRFDAINNKQVSRALFSAVEKWAKEEGMEIIHGPMGYNDLDREGLLIEGFEELSTFEEQYNYPYYKDLIEDYGFEKEVDWLEFKLKKPDKVDERVRRASNIVKKRYGLTLVKPNNLKKFIKKYMEQFFDVLDAAYSPLYGVVPFSEKTKEALLQQFKLILSKDLIVGIIDKEEKLVGFGLAFPTLSTAVNKAKGKLLPFGVFRILKQIKNPHALDLGLIAIRPEYQNKGVNTLILECFMDEMIKKNYEYAETNLMLEDNTRIQNQWEIFNYRQHKRRRSFVKKID